MSDEPKDLTFSIVDANLGGNSLEAAMELATGIGDSAWDDAGQTATVQSTFLTGVNAHPYGFTALHKLVELVEEGVNPLPAFMEATEEVRDGADEIALAISRMIREAYNDEVDPLSISLDDLNTDTEPNRVDPAYFSPASITWARRYLPLLLDRLASWYQDEKTPTETSEEPLQRGTVEEEEGIVIDEPNDTGGGASSYFGSIQGLRGHGGLANN